MTVAKEMIRCPYCREPINAGAVKCKHCHSELSSPGKPSKSLLSRYDNFRTGFFSGILFSLIILVLILSFIYGGN